VLFVSVFSLQLSILALKWSELLLPNPGVTMLTYWTTTLAGTSQQKKLLLAHSVST
jgi:hypothetical protein